MRTTRLGVIAAVLIAAAVISTGNGASASSHPSYPLKNATTCKLNYVRTTVRSRQARRVKVEGKWIVKLRIVRVAECVYRIPVTTTSVSPVDITTSTVTTTTTGPVTTTTTSPVTTTTTSPVTTTTEMQIYDQPTTIVYDNSASFNEVINGHINYIEVAELTITGTSQSPGGGAIGFYDANGTIFCGAIVPMINLTTVISCDSGPIAAAPLTPITVDFYGTQDGYDYGNGSSYAPSSAQGPPDS